MVCVLLVCPSLSLVTFRVFCPLPELDGVFYLPQFVVSRICPAFLPFVFDLVFMRALRSLAGTFTDGMLATCVATFAASSAFSLPLIPMCETIQRFIARLHDFMKYLTNGFGGAILICFVFPEANFGSK